VETKDPTRTPGTWRVSNGAAVPFGDAKVAWAAAARAVLKRTALRYHGYVSYGELAEEVQQLTGVRTRSQMRNWIGAGLGLVADDSHARGEPPLTALCVRRDETVGLGYAYVLQLAGKDVPEDLDQVAADARFGVLSVLWSGAAEQWRTSCAHTEGVGGAPTEGQGSDRTADLLPELLHAVAPKRAVRQLRLVRGGSFQTPSPGGGTVCHGAPPPR
jgi:hypothetical protein